MTESILTLKDNLFSDDLNYLDDLIIESIEKWIDSNDDDAYNVLTECVAYNPKLIQYKVLIETANDYKEFEKTIKLFRSEKDDEKKLGILQKMLRSLKKLSDWWFDVDPNKRFKTLHILLKIILKITFIVLPIIYPYGNIVNNITKTKIGRAVPNIHLPRKIYPYGFTSKLISSLIKTKVVNGRIVITKEGIISNALKTIMFAILQKFQSDINNADIKHNKADIEKNITNLDNCIDEYNRMIDNCNSDIIKTSLINQRKELEKSLAYLIKLNKQIKST